MSPMPPAVPVTEEQLHEAERRRAAGESWTAIATSLQMTRSHLANCLAGRRGPRALIGKPEPWREERPYSANKRPEHQAGLKGGDRTRGETLGRERARALMLIDEAQSVVAHERARQLFERIEDKLDRESLDMRRIAEAVCKAIRNGQQVLPAQAAPEELTSDDLGKMTYEGLWLARQKAHERGDSEAWSRLTYAIQEREQRPWDFNKDPHDRLRALTKRHEALRLAVFAANRQPRTSEWARAEEAYRAFVEKLGPVLHQLQDELGACRTAFLPELAPAPLAPRKARGEHRLRHESARDRLAAQRPDVADRLRRGMG